MEIYTGTNPYIFISYAHEDIEQVLPIIKHMVNDEYRLWFDEKIEIGKEWTESIANHLNQATCFIAYITRNYLSSDNCMDEIEYAKNKGISIIIIYLENFEIPKSFKMEFSHIQSINYNNYDRFAQFFEKLYETSILEYCKENTDSYNGFEKFIGNKKVIIEFKNLLLKFHENLAEFTEGLKFQDDKLINESIERMGRTLHKIQMFSRRNKFLDKKLADNAALIVEKYNKFIQSYSVSYISEILKSVAKRELQELMELIPKLLKRCEDGTIASNSYRKNKIESRNTKKIYEEKEKNIIEFEDLLLKFYQDLSEFTEGLRFADQELLILKSQKMGRTGHKIYMFSNKNKFLDKKLADNAELVIEQYNKAIEPYNKFVNSEDRMSDEAQHFAEQADLQILKLIEIIAKLLKYCEDTTAKVNNYDISDDCVMENKNIKILKENEEIPVEFRSLLLDLYENLTEFTEGLKFSNLELLGLSARRMSEIGYKMYIFLRRKRNRFLNSQLADTVELIIDQIGRVLNVYNKFGKADNLLSEEGQNFSHQINIELHRLIEMTIPLLS